MKQEFSTTELFSLESETLNRVTSIALAGLQKMYCKKTHRFAFTLRKSEIDKLCCIGESMRYGAIVVIGARYLPENLQQDLFAGETAKQFCSRLIEDIDAVTNLGDVALITWAAAELKHPKLEVAVNRIREMSGANCPCPTVEAAWVLSALSVANDQLDVSNEILQAKQWLIGCIDLSAGIFAHHTDQSKSLGGRSHVSCFADQVYPIQALAKYHQAVGDNESLNAATVCAERICKLQGDAGQWWWHYDVRTGNVIEGYPVYSVHQDSMGPMALLDLQEAGGPCFDKAIELSLQWLNNAPEIGSSLIDEENSVIWRKVARAEPKKATRFIRAAATRAHPNLKMRWLDSVFRPTVIDYECRPYHLGWILYTWLRRREQ
ncbi:MAG: hypothetical protein IH984_05155 [Planctomycetes bacterium]|nr:hypothetical protein [Planctomycetota bacterium]